MVINRAQNPLLSKLQSILRGLDRRLTYYKLYLTGNLFEKKYEIKTFGYSGWVEHGNTGECLAFRESDTGKLIFNW